MTRYVIIGAGAVGATVAAELHAAGSDVLVVARGPHLEALRAGGLRYIRPDGIRTLRLPVAGGPEDVTLHADDVLVLAVKSQDTESVLRDWAWRPVDGATAASRSTIVLLQNGLENERAARRRFADVVPAVVWLPSSHLEPGEVVSPAAPAVGALWLGGARGELTKDLRAAGFLVDAVDDIRPWQAGKLLTNVTNVLDALYRPSPLRDAAARVLRAEARAVLSAAGYTFADLRPASLPEVVAAVVPREIPGHARGGSSTWQSLARQAPPETDFLNGEIVLQARLLGREAPLNAAVTERVHLAGEAGALGDDDLLATFPDLHRRTVLIGPDELRETIGRGDAPTLLDVRWALGDPHGHDHYRAGHIPGAVYVDLDTELAAPPSPAGGRHPLPDLEALQAAARRWGVRNRKPVVVYDDNGGTAAARAWWLLRWGGLTDVRILDGALNSWTGELSTGDETPEPGDVGLSDGHLPTLTADEAANLAGKAVLLDARAAERYRGEVEPVDPRAGHIPGALSAPTGDNLTESGAFRATTDLRGRFAALGADGAAEVGVYCGSGVTAAHQIAALAVAGVPAALFPGSWSAWSSDPDRPVATGAEPKGVPE